MGGIALVYKSMKDSNTNHHLMEVVFMKHTSIHTGNISMN